MFFGPVFEEAEEASSFFFALSCPNRKNAGYGSNHSPHFSCSERNPKLEAQTQPESELAL
jgi:hypothetical protein